MIGETVSAVKCRIINRYTGGSGPEVGRPISHPVGKLGFRDRTIDFRNNSEGDTE